MDAVLLVSFGGPESEEEVMPFLRQVTRGRDVPEERLLAVAKHYFARGGISPINEQNRELKAALEEQLRADDLPVFWGNRNSAPWLADAFEEMSAAGVTRAIAVFTSAYSSYSGCRQYRENLAAAAGDSPIDVVKIPAYFNHPGFVEANLDHLLETLKDCPPQTHVLFTTHSIPVAMAESSGPGGGQYVAQHTALAAHLMESVAQRTGNRYSWELVFQSRSGPPSVPWLEPDVNDRLAELSQAGVTSVAIAPLGFISDHMEVVQDLDTEARESAEGLGMAMVRVPTAGVHPSFVAGLVQSVRAVRANTGIDAAFDTVLPTPCVSGCCPNLRRPGVPAICEQTA